MEAGQREAQECDRALDQLQKQKEMLWEHLEKRKAALEAEWDQRIQAGEEESRVNINMDTSDMDHSIVAEQGWLPKAITDVEEQVYHCLVLVEMNQIQWKYEALSYLTSIIKGNQEAWDQRTETRGPGEAYPKMWKYLSFRKLLTQLKEMTMREDPYMSVEARFKAAKMTHDNWRSQQRRSRKPSQSLSQSRSQVDQNRPPLARIRYERMLANILFARDYDEADLLTGGINLFSPHDSDNNMIQKLFQMQELCRTCGQTPADELNQQTLALLWTFRFWDDQPKKKLMVFLGMQKRKNATALLTASEEAIGRVGLSELMCEGIYKININKLLQSALLEVN